MRVSIVIMVFTLLVGASSAHAQDPYNVTVNVTELSRIFTELYGPEGLVVNSLASLAGGVSHSAHFNSGFESEFSQFGTALTGQIVSLPLPAPASGFTYRFDPGLGVFTRSTSSFGPILAERAETIGARRVSMGFAYQRLAFDSIENIDLQSVPAVFTHDNAELRGGREDVITTVNSIDSEVTRSAAFLTYGVTNDFDISIAVPYVTTDIVVTSDATIRRIGTTIPEIHFFRGADDGIGDRRIYTAFGHASGIGDMTIRMKQAIKKSPRNGFALGLDLRLPTGDERNLLGTGAPAVQPWGAWSATSGTLAPHINLGYQWNGSSILAGDIEAGVSEDLPDVVVYALGAVVAVHPRITLALDVLGRYIIDSPRVELTDFHALDGRSVYPNITFDTGDINELSSAVGLKINVAGRLLVNTNLLVRLNDGGLRDKISPLVGIEYAF
jgi:hypothetical protein